MCTVCETCGKDVCSTHHVDCEFCGHDGCVRCMEEDEEFGWHCGDACLIDHLKTEYFEQQDKALVLQIDVRKLKKVIAELIKDER